MNVECYFKRDIEENLSGYHGRSPDYLLGVPPYCLVSVSSSVTSDTKDHVPFCFL
jgi:hypothetical protein